MTTDPFWDVKPDFSYIDALTINENEEDDEEDDGAAEPWDDLDTSITSVPTLAGRTHNRALDESVFLRSLTLAEPEAIRRLVIKGLSTEIFSPDIQAAVQWVIQFVTESREVPSLETVAAKFPATAHLLVAELPQRGLFDSYEAAKLSSYVDFASGAVGRLHTILGDPTREMSEWTTELEKASAEAAVRTSRGRGSFRSMNDLRKRIADYYAAAKAGTNYGLPLPWPFLDKAFLGLQPANIMTLLAQPNQGKTWLLLQALVCIITGNKYWFSSPACWSGDNAAAKLGIAERLESTRHLGRKVLIDSLEMTADDMELRIAIMVARVSFTRFLTGTLSPQDEERLNYVLGLIDGIIEDRVMIGNSTDITQTIALAESFGAEAILIDAVYLADGPFDKRWERVQATCAQIRKHSLDTGISYLQTSQIDANDRNRDAFAQAFRQDSDSMIKVMKQGEQIGLVIDKGRKAPVGTGYRYNLDIDGGRYNEVEKIMSSGSSLDTDDL